MALALLFVVLKVQAGFPFLFDDEHRYFAMGQLISRGEIPYRDFLLTHPALGVLLIGLCDAVAGSHYLLYKAMLLGFSLLLTLFLFITVRTEHGPLAAFFSCGLFLSAETYLVESTFMRGFNLGLVFIGLASYLSRKQARQLLAGAVFGLAFLTGLYAIVPLATFCTYQWWTRGARAAMRMTAGFLLVALPGQLVFLILAGRSYLEQVYLFHTHRNAGWEWTVEILRQVGTANVPLIACGLLGLFLLRPRSLWQERLFLCGFTPAILSFSKIFRSYFLMPIYFLSIPGGVLLARICSWQRRLTPIAVLVATLFILATGSVSFRHYLDYNRKWPIPGVEEVTDTIRSETEEGDLIFGGLVAPLFSFLTGRRVLDNALYTDMEVFNAGLLNIDHLRQELSRNRRIKFVVMTRKGGFLSAGRGLLNRTLRAYFFQVGRYRSSEETIYLLERVGAEPEAHPGG